MSFTEQKRTGTRRRSQFNSSKKTDLQKKTFNLLGIYIVASLSDDSRHPPLKGLIVGRTVTIATAIRLNVLNVKIFLADFL